MIHNAKGEAWLLAIASTLAKTKSADLAEYIGVNSLKPYINKELVLAETIVLNSDL